MDKKIYQQDHLYAKELSEKDRIICERDQRICNQDWLIIEKDNKIFEMDQKIDQRLPRPILIQLAKIIHLAAF